MHYIILLLASIAATQALAQSCPQGPMQALFYQPHFVDLELSSEQWSDRIDQLTAAGIDNLYLQWTDYGEVNFTESQLSDGVSFLPTLAELLLQKGTQLHVGLVADPQWFAASKRRALELQNYLSELRQTSINHAKEIVARFPELHLAGWYLPEEIAGIGWRDPTSQDLLKEHFRQLTQSLRELTPDAAVSVSGFSTGMLSAEEYSQLWKQLLEIDGLQLWHQDGSGTQALEFDERNALLEHLLKTLDDDDDLGVIAELFRQQDTPSGEFAATAVDIEPLSIQLQNRSKAKEGIQIAGFSLRYLFENDGRLISEYMSYYCESKTF